MAGRLLTPRAPALRADTRKVLLDLVDRGCRVKVTPDGTIHITDEPAWPSCPWPEGRPTPRAKRERVNIEGRPHYVPKATRRAVEARDGRVCRYCGTKKGPFHIDHILPVVQGGLPTEDNLTVACRACNMNKGGRSPDEWKGRQ